jgi:hypothetical protein
VLLLVVAASVLTALAPLVLKRPGQRSRPDTRQTGIHPLDREPKGAYLELGV